MAKKKMTEVVNLRISTETRQALERLAAEQDMSLGEVVRKALKDFLLEDRRERLEAGAAALRAQPGFAEKHAADLAEWEKGQKNG